MPTITTAITDDIPQLCALLAILFTQEDDFQPDVTKQSAALNQIIANPVLGCILVLREKDKIVGMVNLLFTVSTACGGKVAMLEDMIVHPSRRNEGLGKLLFQAAIQHARTEGCLRITLLTDRSNSSAIRFYQRFGLGISEMIPLRLNLN
jgi:GNAT superfamily N-acetyltransferase